MLIQTSRCRRNEDGKNEKGQFFSGTLPPGSYRLSFRIGRYAFGNFHQYTTEEIAVGNVPENITVTLPSGSISGTVHLNWRGTLEDENKINVLIKRKPQFGRLSNGTSFCISSGSMIDPPGVFEIKALPSGNYEVTFEKRGFEREVLEVQVGDEGKVALGEIELERRFSPR